MLLRRVEIACNLRNYGYIAWDKERLNRRRLKARGSGRCNVLRQMKYFLLNSLLQLKLEQTNVAGPETDTKSSGDSTEVH